jgi:hypothetical protein
MRRLVVVGLLLLAAAAVQAGGRNWSDHKDPYTFLFGNHIDTHLETRLTNEGALKGFFYVYWTEAESAEGLPVAKHCTTPEHYAAGCFAGWHIQAVPCIAEVNGCEAMFLYHNHDHPVWLVGPRVDSEGNLRGTRGQVPQPGSFTHMHWLTEGADHQGEFLPSSLADVEAFFGVDIAVPEACNVSMAKELTPGVVCPGYFLQIQATETFAFHHGGEDIPVRPGIDNRTHLNLVSSIPSGE